MVDEIPKSGHDKRGEGQKRKPVESQDTGRKDLLFSIF